VLYSRATTTSSSYPGKIGERASAGARHLRTVHSQPSSYIANVSTHIHGLLISGEIWSTDTASRSETFLWNSDSPPERESGFDVPFHEYSICDSREG